MHRFFVKFNFFLGTVFKWISVICAFGGIYFNSPRAIFSAITFVLISICFCWTGEILEKRKRRKHELRTLQNIETRLELLLDDLNRGYPVNRKNVINLSKKLKGNVMKFRKQV